jgi:hypothetical protein
VLHVGEVEGSTSFAVRVAACEPSRPAELANERVGRAVLVVARAEMAQAKTRVDEEALLQIPLMRPLTERLARALLEGIPIVVPTGRRASECHYRVISASMARPPPDATVSGLGGTSDRVTDLSRVGRRARYDRDQWRDIGGLAHR